MLDVRELPEGESLREFIDLEWTLNQSDPRWVPPLRMSVEALLNRSKHPFHEHSEVAYFLATRDGRPAGRIVAIDNRSYTDFHQQPVGFYGLFQCEDNEETAARLLDVAADWLKARGLTSMLGPVNFSTNDELYSPGILIEGFDTEPAFMMAHNPPYYQRLHEAAGMEGVKDLLSFVMDDPTNIPSRGTAKLERLLAREGATVRTLNLRRFRRDVDKIKEVYNSAWAENWGFSPMTNAEFDYLASEFRPVVDPRLVLLAESNGEPIGFSLALPNLNEAIRHIPSGRLFPFGIFKFLWHRRKIRGIRVLTLGFRPRFKRAGLGVAFYLRTFLNGVDRGYIRGEASWILEDNYEMVRAVKRMGAYRERCYRMYERKLG